MSPATVQRLLGTTLRMILHCERSSAAALHHSPKQMDGPDPPVLKGCSQALRFSPRSRQKSLFLLARAARASCSRETLIPAGLPASTLVTASCSACLRKPPLPQGGLGKECTLGRKLHLSLQCKGGSPTGFRLLPEPYFRPNSVSC